MKKMKRYTLKRDRGKVAGKSWWWYIYIRGGREFEIIQPGEISSKRPPRLWHCQDIWRGIVLHQTQFWKWSFFWDFDSDTDYDFALWQLEWIMLSTCNELWLFTQLPRSFVNRQIVFRDWELSNPNKSQWLEVSSESFHHFKLEFVTMIFKQSNEAFNHCEFDIVIIYLTLSFEIKLWTHINWGLMGAAFAILATFFFIKK